MQDNLQPEEFESKVAAELDAWITARLTGREQLASLSNSDSQTVDLAALAQDLLSLAEGIQPDRDFVLDLEASLRRKVLTEHRSPFAHLPAPDDQRIEDKHDRQLGTHY
jgi:hypothetical protein